MRLTVEISDDLYRVLKAYASRAGLSISQYIETAIKDQIEDLEDIASAKARENETTHSFDELISCYKAKGLI